MRAVKIHSVRKIKHKRALLATVVCVLVVGTVAAAIYSNTLSNESVLIAQYPIELEFETGGLFTSSAFCEVVYTDNIIANNLDPDNIHEIKLLFRLEGPVTLGALDVVVTYGPDTLVWAPDGAGMFTSVHSMGQVFPLNSKTQAMTLMFELTAPIGSYTLIVWAELV